MSALPGEYLKNILDDPLNDQPRLAYADWLTARNDPLGEFIRLDCARDKMPSTDWPGSDLKARYYALLKSHRSTWIKPLTELGVPPRNVSYRRGFVHSLEIETKGIVPKLLDRLFDVAPLLQEIYMSCPVDLNALVTAPDFPRLTSLLIGLQAGAVSAAPLAESPNVAGLESLGLYTAVEKGSLKALMTSSHLRNLKNLTLFDRCKYADLDAILSSRPSFSLKTLALGYPLRNQGIELLARSPLLASVEELRLSLNDLGPRGIAALFAGPTLRALRVLNLERNWIGPDGAATLARSPRCGTLTKLKLTDNFVEESGAMALAASPFFTKLEELDLSNNNIESEGAVALAAATGFGELRVLDLSGNPIGDVGLAALATSPHFPNLRELCVTNCEIGVEGIRALCESTLASRLTRLALLNNPLDNACAQLLVDSPHFRELKLLAIDLNFGRAKKRNLKNRFPYQLH